MRRPFLTVAVDIKVYTWESKNYENINNLAHLVIASPALFAGRGNPVLIFLEYESKGWIALSQKALLAMTGARKDERQTLNPYSFNNSLKRLPSSVMPS